uniref:Uncharacterized protein n=1 Tax=viral metagenome TaxID=1070528 RepID=A0A6H2A2F4_9ZZZZ
MKKTINSCLIEAIRIMDEKGRSGHGDSVMLWRREWDCLRTQLIDAVGLHDETMANRREPFFDKSR